MMNLFISDSGSDATVVPPRKTRKIQPRIEVNIETLDSVCDAPAPTVAATPAAPYVPFTLLSGNYEIILCVDVAETSGK